MVVHWVMIWFRVRVRVRVRVCRVRGLVTEMDLNEIPDNRHQLNYVSGCWYGWSSG